MNGIEKLIYLLDHEFIEEWIRSIEKKHYYCKCMHSIFILTYLILLVLSEMLLRWSSPALERKKSTAGNHINFEQKYEWMKMFSYIHCFIRNLCSCFVVDIFHLRLLNCSMTWLSDMGPNRIASRLNSPKRFFGACGWLLAFFFPPLLLGFIIATFENLGAC